MSTMSFEEFMKGSSNTNTRETDYFSLANGETKTVRFMLDSIDKFDLEGIHEVKYLDDKNGIRKEVTAKVPCLGNDCPFCKAGIAIKKRFFIPMIEYSQDGSSHKFVTWDKAKDTAQKLATFLNDYGPLSQILCNITRTGEKLETEYTISPNVKFNLRQNYPIDEFPDIKPSKYHVRHWNAEDMNYFLQNGTAPVRQSKQQDNSPEANAYYDAVAEFNEQMSDPLPFNDSQPSAPPQFNTTAPTFSQQFEQQQTNSYGRQRY